MSKKLIGIALAIVVFLGLSGVVSATTITFLNEADGDTVGTMNDVYNFARNISVTTPTKDGYTFAGWATSDAAVILGNNTVRVNGSWVYGRFTGPRTGIVYGTWDAEVYGIEYDLDGGVEPNPANPVEYTIEDEVTITDPTKDGYDFAGWLDATGVNLGKNLVLPVGTTGDKEFIATWEEVKEETPAETTPVSKSEEPKKTVNNPKTGINTAADTTLLIIGLISFIGLAIYNPKKSN